MPVYKLTVFPPFQTNYRYTRYIPIKGHMTKTAFYPDTMKVADRVIILGRALQKNYDRDYVVRGHSGDTVFDVVEGRKYWKINMINNQESVHAFIDKKTGDVFKPASWRGPAKIARYNLIDEVSYGQCVARADWAGGYLYLR